MNDETKQALQRWREHRWPNSQIKQYSLPEQAYKDMLTLADAYEFEHTDDDKPQEASP